MILRDPVHGLVSFESRESSIVPKLLECREVQRLRRIRQLGLASFAFPGAEHTRFAHAIGTAHVMIEFVSRLRQIDGDLPFWQRVTTERARDAIAAALLHDLGHGPFSHLFEVAFPGALLHEKWTDSILLDPSTDVHKVLAAEDPQLPNRAADLIKGQHEMPYLAKAVSGTFDVDRCDYLLRDAHATGVGYGEYDLPWVLRSLRFNLNEGAPGLAVDGQKGVSAIESFILARYFMFQQVYFHKATRSAEWMIGAILRRVLFLLQDGTRLPSTPGALLSVAAGRTPTLGEFLELDDPTLLVAIHEWERSSDKVLADLSRRIQCRGLFKTLELFPVKDPDLRRPEHHPEHALHVARSIAAQHGLLPELYVGLDNALDTPYGDDDSIEVVFAKGPSRKLTDVSFLLERLENESITRTRLIFTEELREPIQRALFS